MRILKLTSQFKKDLKRIQNNLNMEKIVEDYYNYISTIIRKSYNFKVEDEDEMISDVFLIIWKNRDKLRRKEKFSPYIAGITKKVIYRKYNKINIPCK